MITPYKLKLRKPQRVRRDRKGTPAIERCGAARAQDRNLIQGKHGDVNSHYTRG
jgi:hypothetical protein